MNKELLRYYLALIRYQLSLKIPFLKVVFKTNTGFCDHFITSVAANLPVLYRLKEKSEYKKYHPFWFKPGDLKSRIELLEKAIELCKNN